MTLTLDKTEQTGISERRLHTREKVTQTVYVELDEGNGGIILNISEGGFAVQAAMALVYDELPRMRFRFPNSKNWIKVKGAVVWKGESRTMAGVKFVDLPQESRDMITEWISTRGIAAEEVSDPVAAAAPAGNHGPGDVPAESPAEADISEEAEISEDTDIEPDDWQSESSPLAAQPKNGAHSTLAASHRPSEGERPGVPAAPRRPKVSRSQLKRYLVDERHRIRLYDLVSEETEKLCAALTEKNFPSNVPVTPEELLKRVHRYEELSDELVSIFITGSFWGEKNQELIWVKLLERVANAPEARTGYPQWLSLQLYPALLLLYAGGVAAIANEKYSTLEGLLVKPRLIGPEGDCRLVDRLSPATVFEDERLSLALNGNVVRHAPVSSYLCSSLRDRFREFVPADDVYDDIFDQFEYMYSLVWIDENPIGASLGWMPLGRFAWRHLSGLQYGTNIVGRLSAEVAQLGKDWPAFRAGLFGGSMRRFMSARNRVATFMASQR